VFQDNDNKVVVGNLQVEEAALSSTYFRYFVLLKKK